MSSLSSNICHTLPSALQMEPIHQPLSASQTPYIEETTKWGEMFNAIYASLEGPSRSHLTEIMQSSNNRRWRRDRESHMLLFHQVRDNVLEAMGRSHMSEIVGNVGHFTMYRNNSSSSNIQAVYYQSDTPLNDCKSLSEDRMFSILDSQTKKEYIIARFTGQRECIQIGSRYFQQLLKPDHMLHDASGQLPSDNDSYQEEDRNENIEEDSDDDMYYSDEDSEYSGMSEITDKSDVSSELCEVSRNLVKEEISTIPVLQ